jgi:predicted glycoside hydrolase/deacetylase ChbG (UPF0249 family)
MIARHLLIVNADDFGRSPGVNRGISRAHEGGIVTSASLMVRWPSSAEAAAYGRAHAALSVGLHVDLGEWEWRDHAWAQVYEVVEVHDRAAVALEVARQLTEFRRLMGRQPTHLDSHQHVHHEEPVLSVLKEAAADMGIPLRHYCSTVRYYGNFYGQNEKGVPCPEAIRLEELLRILADLPPGVTELGCHPGEDENLDAMYLRERAEEVRVLCDPRLRTFLRDKGIELRSFHDVP